MRSAIFILILLSATLPSFADCGCEKVTEKFLPFAKKSDGIIAYVEILSVERFQRVGAFPVDYYQLSVLNNLSDHEIPDTINLKIAGGIECCLSNLIVNKVGERAIIHAFEWDETDYGYNQDEVSFYCLFVCMVSSLRVENGVAIGPITKKKTQHLPIDRILRKF